MSLLLASYRSFYLEYGYISQDLKHSIASTECFESLNAAKTEMDKYVNARSSINLNYYITLFAIDKDNTHIQLHTNYSDFARKRVKNNAR